MKYAIFKKIDKTEWDRVLIQNPRLQCAVELIRAMKHSFPNGDVLIVGGTPRDILMGNEIDDVDMATNIPFDQLSDDFKLVNISKNDSQPVYNINYNGYNFDLAKFREDSQTSMGRQNNVSKEVDSFEIDTRRRDITINSFGLDYKGRIVDYQGGLDDLRNKIVRAVGDAKERFKEDATRILRIFRFAAKMDFDIDPDTLSAAKELKHLLSDPNLISSQSIAQEMFKAAKSGKTLSKYLHKLHESGLLEDFLPEFTAMDGMMHSPEHHPEGESKVLGHIHECLKASPYFDPVINLAVLFHDFGKAVTLGDKNGRPSYNGHEGAGVPIVENIFKRLKFNDLSQQDKKNILMAVEKHMLIHKLDELNSKTLLKLIHDPSWNVVKATGYCDEASRGAPLFNEEKFQAKIKRAEDKVAVGGDREELKKRIAAHIDGRMLMSWFPELEQDKTKIGKILPQTQDFVANQILSGNVPKRTEIVSFAQQIYKSL
jgi:tRNA nucleotidyltransferase/poly(A) polymerase